MLSNHLVTLLLTAVGHWVPPSEGLPTTLTIRAGTGTQGVASWITAWINDENDVEGAWAWDYETFPDMCSVAFSTYAGGGCKMSVTCDDGERKYDDFQVCEVNKEQKWNDDRIGAFSIEYTEAGGINSDRDGLHHPVLRFKNIGDWEPLVVEDVAVIESGLYSDRSYVCAYDYNNEHTGDDGKLLEWNCGVPRLGRGFHHGGTDVENDIPDVPGEDYAVGTCALHLVQHQKDDPETDPYQMEIWIKDANQEDIGSIYPAVNMPAGVAKDVNSKLGQAVVVMMHKVDEDPVSFVYGEEEWDTNTPDRCDVGDYDNGMRQMDCEFKCKDGLKH